jgi:DNA-3-methyladenine glycosylase I
LARLGPGLARDAGGVVRCAWCGQDPVYQAYHDREWGRPVTSDARLFEKLCLEGFQSGLSWITILRKREAFRSAFRGFDVAAVARMGPRDVERLLGDASIVRHRGKIESTVNNARQVLAMARKGVSLARHVWSFRPLPSSRPRRVTRAALVKLGSTAESAALSRDLKARGWSYVGPTTVYAFMQSIGLVNDHIEGCPVRGACETEQRETADRLAVRA